MKLLDIIKDFLLSMKRDKKNRFILIISVICSLIVLLSITIFTSFHSFIITNYETNIGFRTLDVFFDEQEKNINSRINEDELKNIEHVSDVYNSKYYSFTGNSSFKSENYNGIITLTSLSPSINIEVVQGENIGNKTGVAICPLKFYPDSSIGQGLKVNIKSNEFMDTSSIIGKEFEFYYSIYKENEDEYRPIVENIKTQTFKIIGLYNSNSTLSNANQCYVALDDIKDIVDVSNPNIISSSYVFVDDIKNIDSVIKSINDLGYVASVANYFDQDFINGFKTIVMIITTIFMFLAIILQVLYVSKKIISEYRNIGVQMAFGFSMKQIRKKYLLEILVLFLITFIFSSAIYYLLYLVLLRIFLTSIEIYGIKIVINLYVFGLTFIGVVVSPYFISAFIILTKTRRKIIDYLRAEE